MPRTRYLVYPLFLASGSSGLVYELVWIRHFGLLFGSTIYSAAVVTSLFMCGLGVGSYLAGRWADRRFRTDASAPLRAYGLFEIGIAGLALLGVFAIPQLALLAASAASYAPDAEGWYRLAPAGSLVRYACAVALLGPITLLMGGTLTLLIRYMVGEDVGAAGWHVGALYGVNTAGAALGCLLTDTALVPLLGLRATQLLAVGLNLFAGIGALALARGARGGQPPPMAAREASFGPRDPRVAWASLAVALGGCAAMGMQILWFRHLISLFGAYRQVFSMLLSVILVGIWLGSLLGGALARRSHRPGGVCALALGGFAVWSLSALWVVEPDPAFLREHVLLDPDAGPLRFTAHLLERTAWVVGPPALLAGTAFPLANALVQRVPDEVGRRAGILYLSNTAGGVLGALWAGFFGLPALGIQGTASWLVGCTLLAVCALALASRGLEPPGRGLWAGAIAATLLAALSWERLPDRALLLRTLPRSIQEGREQLLALREGVNETLAVSEQGGIFLRLSTNGHTMSGTAYSSQRYMRAFVHVPMLLADGIESVLLMCFGVGNTADAALLYPEVRRLDVVDLSPDVLAHSRFFEAANGRPLEDPRVRVHVNDARQHLRMLDGEAYDLITGEPPPIAFAGVVNLYTREFFASAEERLRPGGFVTYWLPAIQVGEEAARAVVAAFVEVFPESVLLSGWRHQLILVGRKGAPIELDPERMRRRVEQVPGLHRELRWLSMDRPADVVAMLAATAETLERATRGHPPVSDDHPQLEYASRMLRADRQLPADLFSVADAERFCPRCFDGGLSASELEELRGALSVIAHYYRSAAFLEHQPGQQLRFTPELSEVERRAVRQSAYLERLADEGPSGWVKAALHWRHGDTLAAARALEALLARQPDHLIARVDLAHLYLELGRPDAARAQLEAARALAPGDRRIAAAWRRLGDGPEPQAAPAGQSAAGRGRMGTAPAAAE
jgi:predicted membrane-bound spermidine synthase